MILAGFTIAITAAATLRRFYSSTLVIRKNHHLVTHGMCRLVRHPLYLGVLFVCLGIPVSSSSLAGFLTMVLLIPILLFRVRLEERLLTEEFGETYEAYRKKTRALIPFLF